MSLSKKERVLAAICHQQVDHLPTQINYTQSMGEKLAQRLNVPLTELPDRLGNHLLRVDISYPSLLSDDGKISYDWWGAGWHTETEGYWSAYEPLVQSKALDEFSWPDPNAPHLLDRAAEAIAEDEGQRFVVPNFGFCLFERAWSLRGFEQLNMDLALDQGFVADLLDRITGIQLVLARRFVQLGVDGGYFGDDYGAQKGTLFSPQTWRDLFKPRLARMFAVFREAGLPVLMHSDGDISAILPDLVEIGLTTLNPVQPEVLDFNWLRQTFGESLSYYGGVSTQTSLPAGSPQQVRTAAWQAVDSLAPRGTGLILAPSHRMMTDIPLENVEALLDVFAQLAGES